jgi:hypothetical protein
LNKVDTSTTDDIAPTNIANTEDIASSPTTNIASLLRILNKNIPQDAISRTTKNIPQDIISSTTKISRTMKNIPQDIVPSTKGNIASLVKNIPPDNVMFQVP